MHYMEWAKEIVNNYCFRDPHLDFIRHNENVTFRVTEKDTHDRYLLRIHCPATDNMRGLQHTYLGVQSELELLSALSHSPEFLFQTPVANRNEELVTTHLIGQQSVNCSILSWIDGAHVSGEMLTTAETASAFGRRVAELHQLMNTFSPGANFVRPQYGQAWVHSMLDKLRPCEELGLISTRDMRIIENTFFSIHERLNDSNTTPETWGLIHSDVNFGNLIRTDSRMSFIDFGLSGYGHYAMDVAMGALLVKRELRDDFLLGYNAIRPGTDVNLLGMFMLLSVFGYYAFQVSNQHHHQWIRERAPILCSTRCIDFLNDKELFYDF